MNNENGFVLVGALLILVLLVLIGISATTSSVLELQIAGADRTHAETFFQADSGVQLAASLIEEAFLADTAGKTPFATVGANSNNTIAIPNILFWQNSDNPAAPDIVYSPDGPAASRQTNLTAVIDPTAPPRVPGSDFTDPVIQTVFVIQSQHSGVSRSTSTIQARWRHIHDL